MITLLLNTAIWCHTHRLKIIATILLFIIGNTSTKAQTAAGDVFTTLTYLPTTFGWVAPYWMAKTEAQDSITSMKSTIATKMAIAAFTGAAVVGALGFTPYNATNPDSYINTAGARTSISLTTTGSGAASYSNSTGVLNIPTGMTYTAGTGIGITSGVINNTSPFTVVAPTAISAGARSFNTAYQISTTLPSHISISPQISCNLSLTGGQSGTITLEISPNGSSGWVYCSQLTGSNIGTLTIGLNTTQLTGGELTADLPAGYYWRATTNNITGTPVYTFNGGSYRTF